MGQYTRFALAAARRFARLPFGAFIRKLSASGYPLHLPQAMWVNSHLEGTVKQKNLLLRSF